MTEESKEDAPSTPRPRTMSKKSKKEDALSAPGLHVATAVESKEEHAPSVAAP
eukprot:CAMPEP_0113589176 /NCGR_PEP_ID=MMETSP0015_2-20120614/35935_1 /TAXON_ID=2838 /ORGANISM="Odontella" /LENGTH=52 /DNA_ID=CAMNT_0000495151 /DNA_START=59 /DNA_END=213 /DNA_ORIENTATION=- /assembly_acc=CAM_ASM_000160